MIVQSISDEYTKSELRGNKSGPAVSQGRFRCGDIRVAEGLSAAGQAFCTVIVQLASPVRSKWVTG